MISGVKFSLRLGKCMAFEVSENAATTDVVSERSSSSIRRDILRRPGSWSKELKVDLFRFRFQLGFFNESKGFE